MSLLIKNGNVFTAGIFIKADILIEGTTITKIGQIDSAEKVIDASDRLVVPGFIDAHVHFRDPGETIKEDWTTGSRAALSSGITTVIDMPNNKVPIITIKRLEAKQKIAQRKSAVNLELFMAVNNNNIQEVNKSGVRFVKLYHGMTTGNNEIADTEAIFRELRQDIMIAVHAEDNGIIDENRKKADKKLPDYHSLIRNNKAEYTAVNYLIELAEKYDRSLHICHVSTKEAALLIAQAKKNGLNITCETCPQYLFLDDSAYEKLGKLAKVNPALKSKQDTEVLWSFLNNGTIDIIASDHAPHLLKEKKQNYDKCPAGFPGVETTVPLMLTAVNEGRLPIETFVRAMSENPARIYRLDSGEIKEGDEADIAIIDMNAESIITGKNMQSKAKWSPFEGFKTQGKAVITIRKGVVHEN
jgi:dihydroorotase